MQKKVDVEIFGLARDDSGRAGGRHQSQSYAVVLVQALVPFPAPENWFDRRQHLILLLCVHQQSLHLVRKYQQQLTKKLNCSMRH